MPKLRKSILLALTSALAALAACSSSESAVLPAALDASTTSLPLETSPPTVYVAKVKNVLVGLPPTADEIAQVEADPTKLATLIDGWMKLPQYETKMLRFFQLAFQQTQITDVDFTDQTFPKRIAINKETTPLVVQNASESFARTIFALIGAGRPLTDALTTKTFMMTPGLAQLYAFLDAWQVDDAGKVTVAFDVEHKNLAITVSSTQVPIEQSIDPTSPSFMHWYFPNLAAADAKVPGCFPDPLVLTVADSAGMLQRILTGSLDGRPNPAGGTACPPVGGNVALTLTGDDWTSWKMVTVRPPRTGEKTTSFLDVPTLRNTTELVLDIPRTGFFSTPAFFANWQTNTSNQMRVTLNQALIVALGASVDGTDTTHPAATPGLDAAHASDPACVSCHQTLDPTRSVFAANLSWNYHLQKDVTFSSQPEIFAFEGVTTPVRTLDDLGATLAAHPLFAQAWASKLCYYANSRKCDDADPELQRVVAAFKASNFDWSTLVRELLSSPITTNATATKTLSDQGEVIAVSRRDHLCAALDVRLGFDDVCGLIAAPAKSANHPLGTIGAIASGLPSDGYGRGAVAPVLPNAPTLFYRAGIENICETVATLVIDPTTPTPNARTWSSGNADAAITDFVATMMALTPADPRTAPVTAALHGHLDAAKASGASVTDALRSTFVVACLAPTSTSVGL